MKLRTCTTTVLLLAFLATVTAAQERLQWTDLPALPDTPGFGGPFVGTHADRLIVAGGANFPTAPPWQGGKTVLALDPGATAWRKVGKLDGPRAYGTAISTSHGLALLGGNDSERYYADCQLLIIDQKTRRARFEALPPLPTPTAFSAAAANGDTIYVAAGSHGSDPAAMTHAFWSLNLAAEHRNWKVLPAWPGPARHKAVAAFQSNGSNGCFYLFSGEIPRRRADGKITYDYRTDGYRFDTKLGSWHKLNDLPIPVAAACAIATGQSHVLVFSGSTGEHVLAPDPRPEFPRIVRSALLFPGRCRDAFRPLVRAPHVTRFFSIKLKN